MSKINVVAIIPARGGSKRIPGKNYKMFNDKPIIKSTIEKLKKLNVNLKLISDGRLLKKYISSGKRLILKVLLKNSRIFSI